MSSSHKIEIKVLDIIWFTIFILGVNGYIESFKLILFVGILFIIFKAMDYFFSGSKLLVGVKIITVAAILYRSGDYGRFINPIWVYNLFGQLSIDIQHLAFGNIDRIQAFPMVLNLIIFLIFRELMLTERVGSRFTLISTFAGGSLLVFLSIVQGTKFSLIVISFIFIGIIKIIFENMLISKLTLDLDRFTFTMLTGILLIIILIWTYSTPISLAYELESLRNKFQGGFSSEGSGGDASGTRLSGYNSNDLILGGPIELNDRPVLRIRSSSPIYLRGESKYLYTGSGWSDDIISRETVAANNIPFSEYPGVEYEEINVNIEVLSGSYPVIFSGLGTKSVDINRGNWIVLGNETDLFINYLVVSGDKYQLVLQSPLYTEEFLKRSGTYRDDFPLEEYTNLPVNFPQTIVELANEITRGYNNNYDKALAIQDYLRSREFAYSLDVGFPPPGMDFVEHFLMEKEGYCVHFSTAFVVMARSVGIPARWVKGYTSGTRTAFNEYTISDKHAHAWGEIYLPHAGWITFEPTPGFLRRQYSESGNDTNPTSPTDPVEEPTDHDRDVPFEEGEGNVDRAQGGVFDSAKNKIIIIPLILFVIFALAIFGSRKNKQRLLTPNKKLVLLYNKVLHKLRLFGLGKARSETPKEYLNRIAKHTEVPFSLLSALTGVFESVYYGNDNLEDDQYEKIHKKHRKFNYFILTLGKLKNKQ